MALGSSSKDAVLADRPLVARAPVVASLVHSLVDPDTSTPIRVAALSALSRVKLSGDTIFSLLADIATTSEIIALQMLAVRAIGNMHQPPTVAVPVVAHVLAETTSSAVARAAITALSHLILAMPGALDTKAAESIVAATVRAGTNDAGSTRFRSWQMRGARERAAEASRAVVKRRLPGLVSLAMMVAPGAASRCLGAALAGAKRLSGTAFVTSDAAAWERGEDTLRLWGNVLGASADREATEAATALLAQACEAAAAMPPAQRFREPRFSSSDGPCVFDRVASLAGFWRGAVALVALACGVPAAVATGDLDRSAEHLPDAGADVPDGMPLPALLRRLSLPAPAASGLLLSVGAGPDTDGWWSAVAAGGAPASLLDRLSELCIEEAAAGAGRARWLQAAATALTALLARAAGGTSAVSPLRAAALSAFLRATPHDGFAHPWGDALHGTWSDAVHAAVRHLEPCLDASGGFAATFAAAAAAGGAPSPRWATPSTVLAALLGAFGGSDASEVKAAILRAAERADPSLVTAEQVARVASAVAVGALRSEALLRPALAFVLRSPAACPDDVAAFVRWLADGAAIGDGADIPAWCLDSDGTGLTDLGRAVLLAALRGIGPAAVPAAREAVRAADASPAAAPASASGAGTAAAVKLAPPPAVALVEGIAFASSSPAPASASSSAPAPAPRAPRIANTSGPVVPVRDVDGAVVLGIRIAPTCFRHGGGLRPAPAQWMRSLAAIAESLQEARSLCRPDGPKPAGYLRRALRRGHMPWAMRGDPSSSGALWVAYYRKQAASRNALTDLLRLSGRKPSEQAGASAAVTASGLRALEDAAVMAAAEGSGTKTDAVPIRALGRVSVVLQAQLDERRALLARWALARRAA